MSDINNKNMPERDDSELLGLDNESILSRHKSSEKPPVNSRNTVSDPSRTAAPAARRPQQRPAGQQSPAAQRQAAQRLAAQRQAAQRPQGSEQATRKMPRQPVQGSSAATPPRTSGGNAVPQRPSAPAARRPAAAQKPENAAVVPAAKKEVEAKPAAAAPAYAARRSVVPAASSSSENSGGTKNTSASISVDAPFADSKKGSTKAGADMMVSIVKGIIYMVLVLVVSVFISIFVIRVGNDVFAFVKSDEQIDITIPEDATTADIADILYDNGIIKYPSIFKIYASVKHEKGDYLGGTYTVSPSLSYDKLRGKFKKQVETGTCWITIPEGYTTDEIIDLMVENGIGERETYIDVINNYDFDYWFVEELKTNGVSESRAYRLDGYLFPDSYQFYKASSEVTVINRLLARFNEVFVEDYRTRAGELDYTVDEILTIASMVEKEAGRSSDFMNVSSVFHNRLNDPYNYARLQSDATTVYAIQIATGQRPKDITPEDNDYDSPYNTYLYEGLPPGPITNPSASAIRYALYPANTNYKYFISANNGTTLFASNKGEHDANIEIVRQMNAD